jgi:hypothetical protein
MAGQICRQPTAGSLASMGSGNAQRIELVFYQTDAGNVPVRDWPPGLSQANRREIYSGSPAGD